MLPMLLILIASCEVDKELTFDAAEPELVLKQPDVSAVYLNFTLPDNPAFTIAWSDDLTGGSSYDIEMAMDQDFTAPMNLGSTSAKNFSMTVAEFNTVLNDMGIASFEDIAVYFRVKAGTAISNSILMLVTTYAVEVPVITGPDNSFTATLSDVDPEAEAMALSWDDPELSDESSAMVVYDVQISPAGTNFDTYNSLGSTEDTTFSISHASLNEMVLTMDGTPGAESSFDIRIVATVTTSSGDLVRTSELVTIGLTPYETALPPVLYVVGAGALDAGWSWDSPVELRLTGTTYVGNIRLTPNNGGNFRFFTERDNWDSGQNYTYYEVRGYTFDPNLTNANDNDNNFLFTGAEGEYSITIDTANETITLGDPITDAFEVSSWGVVGSGYNNWGAFADAPFYTTAANNVFVSYVNLVDGEIKFRQNNSWDAPNINYGDNGGDGTLDEGGANIPVSAGDYKITLDLNSNTYTIEEFSWGIVGSGYNNWGADGPDAKFYYDHTTDTFKVGVRLVDGEIKFRQNNSWDAPNINYGDNGADGTLDEGGANIAVSAGFYLVTLNFNENTYTIDSADILGVVGSGYNDWGATPDFSLTEVQSGVWIAEGVPLIDGEIKFRQNESWDAPNINYGDNGADGTLEEGGANIAVTAGNHVMKIDLNSNTYALGNR